MCGTTFDLGQDAVQGRFLAPHGQQHRTQLVHLAVSRGFGQKTQPALELPNIHALAAELHDVFELRGFDRLAFGVQVLEEPLPWADAGELISTTVITLVLAIFLVLLYCSCSGDLCMPN